MVNKDGPLSNLYPAVENSDNLPPGYLFFSNTTTS
jgi:hypothetical protein